MPTRAQDVMHALYGVDVWAGYNPTRPPGAVRGWHGQAPILKKLTIEASPPVVIDVGVWKGQSTVTIALTMQEAGIDGCVIAVDTFLGSGEHWKPRQGAAPVWEFSRHVGMPDLYEQFLANVWHSDTAGYVVPMPQTSTTAAAILRREKIAVGLVHIDASHAYEDVARDIAAYWPLIARGGYLLGDDYKWPGVQRAADEFSARIGVPLSFEGVKWWVKKAG